MRGAWLILAAAIAGCGESPPTTGSFEVVGHSDLRARGMNAALELADPRAPAKVAQWDPSMVGLRPAGADDILHSVSVSADGTRAYISHQLSGLLIADVSNPAAIALVTPLAAKLDFAPPSTIGPH